MPKTTNNGLDVSVNFINKAFVKGGRLKSIGYM